MAHFAELDESNVVRQVIVVSNNELLDDKGIEQESIGIAFCQSLFGADTKWIQTSYTGNIRKNFAGIGHTYDIARDAFIAPQPFPSWTLDEKTCQWQCPVPYPTDGKIYTWDEAKQSWIEVNS